MHLISRLTMLGIHQHLQTLWYRLIERLEVLWSDVVSNLRCNTFQPCCEWCFSRISTCFLFESLNYQLDWDLDWSGPTLDELHSSIMQYRRRSAPEHHISWTKKDLPSTFAKCKCFLHSALISKRKKIQEPAWSHLIDFLKMRILKKKSSHCD